MQNTTEKLDKGDVLFVVGSPFGPALLMREGLMRRVFATEKSEPGPSSRDHNKEVLR